ncbi:MAG: hypothetical protein KF684_05710 [Phycisphaeraceae bacterium]|nr:hypothetical protein [Phycisphaeraceae bacterium]
MAIDEGNQSLRGLALAQRWLLVVLLAYIAALAAVLLQPSGNPFAGGVAGLYFLLWFVMLAMVAAVTARLGGWAWAVVVTVLMLIPVVNLLTLLAVNQRAVRRLKDAGFTVGLLGVSGEQLRAR